MKRALALLLLCAACSSGPHHTAPGSVPPSLFTIADHDGGPLDTADAGDVGAALDASGFAGSSAPLGFPDGAADAGAPLDAGDVAAAPDAGLDAAPPAPAPNACGGLGPITCTRPPCKPGSKCATVTGCAANVCVDCPGSDIQCMESQCGGSWAWECAGANVLRCTNGRFQCQ